MSTHQEPTARWIRGVNLGGWLVIERYIVPYQYAITDCHLAADFCWYPGALSAPSTADPDYKLCDLNKCKPVLKKNIFNNTDYPVDEWHLAEAFENKTTGERWLNYHFMNFIKRDDLELIKKAGISHVRVPLPHWILGDVRDNEPWIPGDRWKYFVRLCGWCRELGLEVWPNIHTAPGSQNGFDNSGIMSTVYTCGGWGDSNSNIERSLDVLHEVTNKIVSDGLTDVVTGFGLLNEPFHDCDLEIYEMFLDNGLNIVRSTLGEDVQVYVSDLFSAPRFNDGRWWLDPVKYKNTLLDSHFYNVFAEPVRAMSPREHLHLVCEPDDAQEAITSCCYEDAPNNTIPSQGVQRITTEWSAAFDAMPGELLQAVMDGIAANGTAPDFNRTLSLERQAFLKKFVEAQIISYEAADSGVSQGWFFWTIKTEGGAFAEWDFSRGVCEGWIPPIPKRYVSSQEVYGTCSEIINRTNDTMDVVHEYPWGDPAYWEQDDDDVIVVGQDSHSGLQGFERFYHWLLFAAFFVVALIIWRFFRKRTKKRHYTRID